MIIAMFARAERARSAKVLNIISINFYKIGC
jgi:hypothetical protein